MSKILNDPMDVDIDIYMKYNYINIIPVEKPHDENKGEFYKLIDELNVLYTTPVNLDENQNKKAKRAAYKKLLDYGLKYPMSFIETYNNIFTPFTYIIAYCNPYLLQILYDAFLALPKEIQSTFLMKPYDFTTIYNFSPIHLAVYLNRKDALRYLFKIGITVDQFDMNGNTALHLACILKRLDIINIILYYKKSNINLINRFGESPLYICLYENYVDGIKKLLYADADLRYKFKNKTIDIINLIERDNLLPADKQQFTEDTKSVFIEYNVTKGRRKQITKKYKRRVLKNKTLLQEHLALCSNLNEIIDMNLLYKLASNVGIINPNNYVREELCKKIATNIMIKKHSKEFI